MNVKELQRGDRVSFDYTDAGNVQSRRVGEIDRVGNETITIADELRGDFRAFRFDRIVNLTKIS
jgi:predicted DNA-binding transcriptional regulator YafY